MKRILFIMGNMGLGGAETHIMNPKMTLKALFPSILSTSVMTLVAIIIKDIVDSYVWQIVTILICIIIYFSVLFCFADERNKILVPFIDSILKRRKKDV